MVNASESVSQSKSHSEIVVRYPNDQIRRYPSRSNVNRGAVSERDINVGIRQAECELWCGIRMINVGIRQRHK